MSIFGIFIIALIMAFAFSPYKRNNPVAPLLIFFFILLLSGLAAQYWVVPMGPSVWGVSWLPVLVIMFVFGLLFSATPPKSNRRAGGGNAENVEETAGVMGIIIWILLFILVIAVIIGFYNSDKMITYHVQQQLAHVFIC